MDHQDIVQDIVTISSGPGPTAAARGGTRLPHLSVVVPVWNGAERVASSLCALERVLRQLPRAAELVVVDDGSDDEARGVLSAFAGSTPLRVLRNDRNRGKGYSVARGMLAAAGELRVFIDADLAYPPEEIETVVDALERGSDIAIACRVLAESRYVMSPVFFPYLFTRHLMSRAFNAVVRQLLVPGVLDSQAGLKGFTRAAAEVVFPRLTIPGFGFDVECLYIAARHGLRVSQVPVTFRYDDEPSTVRFARDGVRMLADIARIRINGWHGRYA